MCWKNIWLLWGILSVFKVRTFEGKCGGKTLVENVLNGTIILGPDSYPENTHCEWLIRAPLPGQYITLTFEQFDTECSFDFLRIYDGSSTSAKVLATFSGNTLPPVIRSNTSSILLNFFSDNNYVRPGWKMNFTISNCSGGCSGHGTCMDNVCSCDELYTGNACEFRLCPEMCNNITGNGECSQSSGNCICNLGYVGQSCSLSLQGISDVGTWHVISQGSSVFSERFGHAGVYVEKDSAFWIFGGSDLNAVFDDLVKFDFVQHEWSLITPSGPRPSARFRHTFVFYKDSLVLFGGESSNGTLLNDVWNFNISTMEWKRLPGNGVDSPPGLASHTANVIGDELFVYGGRSLEHGISHEMYTYNLSLLDGWKKVVYRLAKTSDLRLVGHTSVYYPVLKSLVIFGGFRHLSARSSEKHNSVYLYHVEHKLWMNVAYLPGDTNYIPAPKAYHSSVVVGDYMVVYGGNVHKHSHDETCYENNFHLFNLKTFTWINSSLLTALASPSNLSWQPQRGRFFSVATVHNSSTLLLSGGFSGIVYGDLLAYKFPVNIVSGSLSVTALSGHSCDLYNEKSCGLDPSCMWCQSNAGCLSRLQKDSCSGTSSTALHLCDLFHQCSSCLAWGSDPALACGWCVQDSRCYPKGTPSGACSPRTIENAYQIRGWWGDNGTFLTSMVECRTEDYPPGLVAKIFYKVNNEYSLDDVSIVNPLKTLLDGVPIRIGRLSKSHVKEVKARLYGFIHPFFSTPINPDVRIGLFIGKISASLHLSTSEDKAEAVKVISVQNKDEGQHILSNEATFFNPAVGKAYYVDVKTEFEGHNEHGHLLVILDRKLVNGSYVRPYFSNECSTYLSCLECLSDASCGWCSSTATCVLRKSSANCSHFSGQALHLVLNVSFCETCAQYVECDSCSNDKYCAWSFLEYCDSRGRIRSDHQVKSCKKSCYSYQECNSCVSTLKCMWCGIEQKCKPWFSYLPDCLHGHCSHWSDRFTNNEKCPDCSQQKTCEKCDESRHCGWCGEYHNGKCLLGGFDGPSDEQCKDPTLSNETNTYSSLWSYTRCPDENECITRNDCHSNATCTNYDGGYRCDCHVGFVGDGHQCNISCNPPCVHGRCNSHFLTCDCDLGWTGNVCSIDCGCNNHSTCNLGLGVCDKCEENTYGEHCEFCLPGSYGNATSSTGCTKCSCNGHGDERRGICDLVTGDCYCLNNTMGKDCAQCLHGFVGHPQRGGGCYYPCKAHSLLSNITGGALSTSNGTVAYNVEDTSCMWIITTVNNQSQYIVFSDQPAPGTITLRIKDLQMDCQTDHVYLYDGFPPYNLEQFSASSHPQFNRIGSLCGFDASDVPSIESHTGTLLVFFQGNVGNHYYQKGFNATFIVNKCPDACTGNRYCFNNGTHESCVCKFGWTGPGCDRMICPANCSYMLGQGYCDQNYGSCVCAEGFAGESCDIQNPFGSFIWETIPNIRGRRSVLPRMGHTMIADNIARSLVIFGGYSFRYGVLGDIWIYDTIKNTISSPNVGVAPKPRYLHAAAVYKRYMYVGGGKTEQDFLSDLWQFDLDSKQWTMAQDLPRRVAGHTLNIVGDTMYLIGGYDPEEYCSSMVYVLKLDSNSTWSKLNPTGDAFHVCFGHTTVYDRKTESLIVFGKEVDQQSATVAVLHLATTKWTVLPDISQPNPRYFHLSLVVGNLMIVAGGHTGKSVQDFADVFSVYNIECDQWQTLDVKGKFPRTFSHSAVASIGEEIYVFGGYNGLASDELFRLNVSSHWCSMFSTRSSCLNIGGCSWCVNKTLNQSFCFNTNISTTLTCSNATVTEGQCTASPKAQALTFKTTSWYDQCDQYSVSRDCSACIQAKEDDGRSASCLWAVDSYQCLSLYFQPILCAFGICGRLLRKDDVCPGPCDRTNYCSDCLEQYNCNWCAVPREDGKGNCMEGTFEGPLNGTCQNNDGSSGSLINSPVWVSSVCLLEDECKNGHHKCNDNETCFDLENGYECHCKHGYERSEGKCIPVCSQGCRHGNCIHPDVCRCSFGWVSANCSLRCQCHGVGHCTDENQLNNCAYCRNNTTGTSCEHCRQGFIGQDGLCVPCSGKCNNNADECYKDNGVSIYGPRSDDEFTCSCKDNSRGKHCDACNDGYFKLSPGSKCERCRCRGHGSTCTPTGLGCDCKNNTQFPSLCAPSAGPNMHKCYDQQCSMCKSSYIGSPETEGLQCYRTMKILQHFSLIREGSQGSRLYAGETNFFYIHPSYTNADIRLTLDVFIGAIDVYIATVDSAFLVNAHQNVSVSSGQLAHLDCYSDGLNKYTIFPGDHTRGLVTGVNHKLVVTFAYEEHQLEEKKFFVVIKAGQSGADGIVYFKQDTSKIDLFVFFSVFFACFFLFLSLIVIGWSIKHRITSRQQVHNREVQRERLESRPRAQFSFLLEYQAPSPNICPQRKTTISTRKAIRPMGVQSTRDSLAAVSTVMFQMPRTDKTKLSIVLGSTLTLLKPQQLDKLAQTETKLTDEIETRM